MSFALVLFWYAADAGAPPAQPDPERLRALLQAVPGLEEAMIYTPAAAQDRYVDDGVPPPLGLQVHFARLETLEAACAADGALQALPGLPGCRAEAQAFWRRSYPVPDPVLRTPAGARPCSYVVHYPGPAADPNAWHAHYIAGHPPLFAQFPGVRLIEILTPVDWVSHLPAAKVHHLQRNRVLFDSPEALTRALQSPVRAALREDYHRFPPYEGGNKHYPCLTDVVRPGDPAGRTT